MGLKVSPFEAARYLGSVVQVDPASVRLNLPHGSLSAASSFSGHRVARGEVGEFVVIEGEAFAILGRIVQVRLPDAERLAVEPTRPNGGDQANPLGMVQLLVSIELASGKTTQGIPEHPRVGQYAYSAHPDFVRAAIGEESGNDKLVDLAHLPKSRATVLRFSPSALFGRHCAILGTTGGGKSWTVARLLEEVARNRGKAILFDPSGEFRTFNTRVRHVYLGGAPKDAEDRREFVSFPYKHLSESDLFAMFQPSGGSQGPKLREALTSLKLLSCQPDLAEDGLLKKAQKPKAAYNSAIARHAAAIRRPGAEFAINLLPAQIDEECIWPSGRQGVHHWGDQDANSRGYCATLISRIAVQIHSHEMKPIFDPGHLKDLTEAINEFHLDNRVSVLRVSMEELPFEHNTRELVANGLGCYLLNRARKGDFRQKPVLVVLDEAHQFLNKAVGDEYNRVRLEAFGLIAKEGRKYGLLTVLATQRPRDIPEDVLSQMGMFIVHRLINDKDRQIIEQACGSLDASAAAFLPVLGQGEALVVGLDTPMSMPVKIQRPSFPPASSGYPLWT